MLSLIRTINKVIVSKFYEQNAGFFLFVFFLMFGIVESSQLVSYHLSLIAGIIESTVFLAVVCTGWLIYMAKCLQFVLSRLDLPENEFLFRLGMMDRRNQFNVIFLNVLLIDLPILIYSGVIVAIAFYSRDAIVGAFILGFHLVLLVLATLIIRKKINSAHKVVTTIQFPAVQWPGPKPFPLFYIGQLTDALKTVMTVTKMFCILALLGFLQIPLDHYDIRVALMGVLFGLSAHAVIVFEFRKFEDRYLAFTRNLPLPLTKRFLVIAIVYVILLLPEAVLLLVNRIHVLDVGGILLFGVSFFVNNSLLALFETIEYGSPYPTNSLAFLRLIYAGSL